MEKVKSLTGQMLFQTLLKKCQIVHVILILCHEQMRRMQPFLFALFIAARKY